jgi:iron(III) transport system permease protein
MSTPPVTPSPNSPPLHPQLLALPQRLNWSQMLLWATALTVVATLLLPPLYLTFRAFEAGSAAVSALARPSSWAIIGRTALLSLSVTAASALIAIPLAWLTVRSDVPLRRFWAVVSALPLVIPSYVGAYLYASALGPTGLLQQLLEPITGITRLPSIYGFWGALFTLTMLSYPYILLSAQAALRRMDPTLEEIAASLGLNRRQTFLRVILPQLRPALGAGGLLVALYVLRDFGAVAIMRYDTFTRIIFQQYRSFDRIQAAFFALLLVGLTLLLVALEMKTRGRASYDLVGVRATRAPTRTALGAWRWPAFIFCTTIASLGMLLPATVLLYWLGRGLLGGESLGVLGPATWSALGSSVAGAVVTVIAALPVAMLVVRQPGRLSALLERLTYAAFALPGIAVALALVFFGITFARWLYQSYAMLILAYMILFLPQAFGALHTALRQIHPSLEESARSLGRRPIQVFFQITLPLIRPGIIAGASLVFLTAMKELPATLLLAPIGVRTLATEVWTAVSEAYFTRAAAPALLLILCSSLPLALLSVREQKQHL